MAFLFLFCFVLFFVFCLFCFVLFCFLFCFVFLFFVFCFFVLFCFLFFVFFWGGYLFFKSTFRGATTFFPFPWRGKNVLIRFLIDPTSPTPGINNEWSLTRRVGCIFKSSSCKSDGLCSKKDGKKEESCPYNTRAKF